MRIASSPTLRFATSLLLPSLFKHCPVSSFFPAVDLPRSKGAAEASRRSVMACELGLGSWCCIAGQGLISLNVLSSDPCPSIGRIPAHPSEFRTGSRTQISILMLTASSPYGLPLLTPAPSVEGQRETRRRSAECSRPRARRKMVDV